MTVDHDGLVAGWDARREPIVFVAMVRDHSAAVHAYLARRAGRQAADDLLGEVWLRAFRSRHNLDQAWETPRPWLYGIARNVLRAHWRLRVEGPDPSVDGQDDPWAGVDDRLDARRLAPELSRGLAKLSPDDREILLLVAWEELSPAEVSVALELPQGTARSRLHRARHLLQHHLDTDPTAQPAHESSEA